MTMTSSPSLSAVSSPCRWRISVRRTKTFT
jgi:hypothetical protein